MAETQNEAVRAVVLAAGQGTRMKSDLPKVLHEVCGEPMVVRILHTARRAGCEAAVVVVGYRRELVEAAVAAADLDGLQVEFAVQEQQLGTADAVRSALPELSGFAGGLLMLNGDVPNIQASTLERLVALGGALPAGMSLVTMREPDPTGYGRIVRDGEGRVTAIVEHRDCTPEQLAITEVNAGLYYASAPFVREHLATIGSGNAQNEFYLTDLVAMAHARDGAVALLVDDSREVAGVNDKAQLAEAEAYALGRDA